MKLGQVVQVFVSGVALFAASGCTHESHVQIRNPLVVRGIDPHKIVRPHAYVEQQRGLPPGSVRDEAQLVSADRKQLCFQVTMHELASIDLMSVDARMSAPKVDAVEGAEVQAEAPTFRTYNGLVPERRQTGMETVCVSRDSYNACLRWETRPTYATFMVPGPVNVYETRGQLCFPNHGVLTPATEQVSLEMKVPMQGVMGMFGSTAKKSQVFRWGFAGGELSAQQGPPRRHRPRADAAADGAPGPASDDEAVEAAPAPRARTKAVAAAPAADDAADDAPPPPSARGKKRAASARTAAAPPPSDDDTAAPPPPPPARSKRKAVATAPAATDDGADDAAPPPPPRSKKRSAPVAQDGDY